MAAAGRISRRRFLALAAGAALAPQIVPSRVFGANDRIAVGYIGVGRRSQQLMTLPDRATVVALSDVYRKRMDDAQARRPVLKDAAKYQDYRELLAQPDIDGVIISTPDHWHALHAIHAMDAGKDIYVEKPMTLTVREGRLMVEAARRNGRICQTGSQQRSNPVNRMACEWIRNGRLGPIRRVHGANYPSPWECALGSEPVPEGLDWDAWCGPTDPRPFHPELYLSRVRGHEAGWISFRPYSGGEMTGWGAHGLDQMLWALGEGAAGPVEVEPLLEQTPPDDGVHRGPRCVVRFRYENGIDVLLDDGGPAGGGTFEGSLGTLSIDRGKYEASKGLDLSAPAEGEIQLYDSAARTLQDGDETAVHLGNWLYCMETRQPPAADAEAGHRAAVMCHLANIARWTGRTLHWNPANERFVKDPEADAYLDRPRRAPWIL